ncbi:MAG: hypothetical protein NT120_02325 [Candidatus Aenigmarchaeota archaeon]|nr:hypothetical protein [Candidatus Aenigmarchaeota archaeon]
MADPFTILVANLNSLGFFGFLLPFIFIFAIVYALLLKSKYFEDQKIIGVLSLVFAFFVIGFGGPALANFFVNLFGMATVILAGLLVIMMFIAMSGADASKVLSGKAAIWAIAAVGIIIFVVALGAFGVSFVSDSVIGIIFVIIILALAILFVTGKN